MTTWCEFEKILENEFLDILNEYRRLRNILHEDTRKDFIGLLRYTVKDRQSFRNLLSETENLGCGCEKDSAICDTSDLKTALETLLQIDPSNITFSSHYSHFSSIFLNWSSLPSDSLVTLCEKYWKARYPSVKESFILPLSVHIFKEHNERYKDSKLKSLLTARLLKGKLTPFDQSVALAKVFDLNPCDFDYCDNQLAALIGILRNHQQSRIETLHALKQSGCHCD